MTRKEALNKAIIIVGYFEAHFAKSKEAREDLANIIEALEQEQDILDKIRDEIMSKDGLEEALEIIDKYKEGGA